jgi:tripartite-type tricarboxylate transporter receptor subunit TctC
MQMLRCGFRVTMAGLCVAVFAGFGLALAPAAAQESFYQGKTVRVIVTTTPGGGFDFYARLFARHLPRHIPGRPRMIVQNMPGGGGTVGTNYVFNIAKPDGLTISHLQWDAPQKEFLGASGVKYRAMEFEWLGLANSSVITIAVRPDAPVQTLKEWLDPKTPKLIFGCTSVGSLPCDMVLAVNDIFGPISDITTGYLSLTLVRTAVFRKEVDALTGWTWDSVKAVGLELIDKGDLKLLAYVGQSRHPELDARKIPYLNDHVKREEDRALLDILAMPATMVRPWAAPPRTPKDRVEILRKAFLDVTKDPEFLREAEKLRAEISPQSGQWLEEFLRKSKESLSPEVRNRARKLLGIE